MSKKVIIQSLHLLDSLSGWRFLGWKVLSFQSSKALNQHWLLASSIAAEMFQAILFPDPLYMTQFFFSFLEASSIFPLSLV